MKLKTLKDLEQEKEDEGLTYEDSIVTGDELKQEAIKWIKQLDSAIIRYEINTETCPYCRKRFDNPGNQERLHTIEFIKYFFNLTEEDLK